MPGLNFCLFYLRDTFTLGYYVTATGFYGATGATCWLFSQWPFRAKASFYHHNAAPVYLQHCCYNHYWFIFRPPVNPNSFRWSESAVVRQCKCSFLIRFLHLIFELNFLTWLELYIMKLCWSCSTFKGYTYPGMLHPQNLLRTKSLWTEFRLVLL